MVTSTAPLREELRETIELREFAYKEIHLIESELRRYKRQMTVSSERIQLMSKELGKIEKTKRTKLLRTVRELDRECVGLDWKLRGMEVQAGWEARLRRQEEAKKDVEKRVAEETEEKK